MTSHNSLIKTLAALVAHTF